MTFGELKNQVGLYSNALKALGVKKGDRVVGYMPNCPEAIIGKGSSIKHGFKILGIFDPPPPFEVTFTK